MNSELYGTTQKLTSWVSRVLILVPGLRSGSSVNAWWMERISDIKVRADTAVAVGVLGGVTVSVCESGSETDFSFPPAASLVSVAMATFEMHRLVKQWRERVQVSLSVRGYIQAAQVSCRDFADVQAARA
jgi:hypothetical protein